MRCGGSGGSMRGGGRRNRGLGGVGECDVTLGVDVRVV